MIPFAAGIVIVRPDRSIASVSTTADEFTEHTSRLMEFLTWPPFQPNASGQRHAQPAGSPVDAAASHRGPMAMCHSRASETAMPGSCTHGCLCSHHTSTPGATPERSSSVPAFTASTPAGTSRADTIGEPH